MAKTRYRPWDPALVPKLEGRAEALAGTFNAPDVANTLWAYATMGRELGAGVMWVLEGQAEALAGTFNTQDVANTLWAYATMRREPAGGAGGGGGVHVQRAGHGKHATSSDHLESPECSRWCAVTARVVHVRGSDHNQDDGAHNGNLLHRPGHLLWACDDGAGARGRGDAGAGGAGGHVQGAERGKHAVGGVCAFHLSRPCGTKSMGAQRSDWCAWTRLCASMPSNCASSISFLWDAAWKGGGVWKRSRICGL